MFAVIMMEYIRSGCLYIFKEFTHSAPFLEFTTPHPSYATKYVYVICIYIIYVILCYVAAYIMNYDFCCNLYIYCNKVPYTYYLHNIITRARKLYNLDVNFLSIFPIFISDQIIVNSFHIDITTSLKNEIA